MKSWEVFESDCTAYLNYQFGKYAEFIHQGGCDATVPDILVNTHSGNTFFIDAKHSPAQCGQFVLKPNIHSHSFKYSPKNVNPMNKWTNAIITYMNTHFDTFKDVGTAGKDIVFDNSTHIFSNWIKEYYKTKGVNFFITNNYTILPIEKFDDYFNITAKYRIKRSGSSSLGKNRVHTYAELLSNNKICDYNITNVRTENNKLFVSSEQNLHNHRFSDEIYEYMFSAKHNEYELRKLSNTYHANVIFSIHLKNNIHGISDMEFIKHLL